jgi:hypothetical protein
MHGGKSTATASTPPPAPAAQLKTPPAVQVVGGADPAAVAGAAALFASAPVAVVLGSTAPDPIAVAQEVSELGAKAVLSIAASGAAPTLGERLPGVDVVTDIAALPPTSRPDR